MVPANTKSTIYIRTENTGTQMLLNIHMGRVRKAGINLGENIEMKHREIRDTPQKKV